MILTVISPTRERWSVDPAPATINELHDWIYQTFISRGDVLEGEVFAAAHPILLKEIPKGKSLLNHRKDSGWQAIISNP
jgi:hypothetical protein